MGSSSLQRFVLLLLCLSDSLVQVLGLGGIGINYGQIANNLPPPSRVVILLGSLNITRVKLYDADPNVLRAFAGSGVEFMVGLGNDNLANVADPNNALAWIQQNVHPYIAQTNISTIMVGNEVFATNSTQYMSNLLPAMQSVHKAIGTLGLTKQVSVTTAHSLNILGTSFPPSSGSFRQDLTQYIQPLLDFHARIKSPFLINAYPFFAYKDNPKEVSLAYALFQPNQGTTDPSTKLKYDNMLYAQIDAVYSAIKAMGHSDVEVRISETGWPSKGDSNEVGANLENAALYNGNLMKRIRRGEATPAKPTVPLDVHVFALFNEDLKPGPTSERNYGLFYPDTKPVYNIGFQASFQVVPASANKIHALSIMVTRLIFVASCLIYLG